MYKSDDFTNVQDQTDASRRVKKKSDSIIFKFYTKMRNIYIPGVWEIRKNTINHFKFFKILNSDKRLRIFFYML